MQQIVVVYLGFTLFLVLTKGKKLKARHLPHSEVLCEKDNRRHVFLLFCTDTYLLHVFIVLHLQLYVLLLATLFIICVHYIKFIRR